VLTGNLEWLAAGGDHPQPGRSAKDLGHEPGSRSEQVFAVVQHQQQLPVAQRGDQNLQRLRAGLVSEVQGGDHGVGHQGFVADLGQLDSQAPSAKPRPRSAAARTARRVLPTPPGPTRLTRRAVVSLCLISPSSRRRPTKLVSSAGRLPDGGLDLAMVGRDTTPADSAATHQS
jgi:hypothetical protein